MHYQLSVFLKDTLTALFSNLWHFQNFYSLDHLIIKCHIHQIWKRNCFLVFVDIVDSILKAQMTIWTVLFNTGPINK